MILVKRTLEAWAKDWKYLVSQHAVIRMLCSKCGADGSGQDRNTADCPNKPHCSGTIIARPIVRDSFVTPDTADPAYDRLRVEAFHLSDYLVSSVTGGSIWFIPRGVKL